MKSAIASSAAAVCVAIASTLCGCAHLPREEAVPAGLTASALPGDAADVRFWPDLDQGRAVQIAESAAARERNALIQRGRFASAAHLPPASYLALSSGGDDGAFAAGLLVGWTSRGDRRSGSTASEWIPGASISPCWERADR